MKAFYDLLGHIDESSTLQQIWDAYNQVDQPIKEEVTEFVNRFYSEMMSEQNAETSLTAEIPNGALGSFFSDLMFQTVYPSNQHSMAASSVPVYDDIEPAQIRPVKKHTQHKFYKAANNLAIGINEMAKALQEKPELLTTGPEFADNAVTAKNRKKPALPTRLFFSNEASSSAPVLRGSENVLSELKSSVARAYNNYSNYIEGKPGAPNRGVTGSGFLGKALRTKGLATYNQFIPAFNLITNIELAKIYLVNFLRQKTTTYNSHSFSSYLIDELNQFISSKDATQTLPQKHWFSKAYDSSTAPDLISEALDILTLPISAPQSSL